MNAQEGKIMAYHSKSYRAGHNGDVAYRSGDVRSGNYWIKQSTRWFSKAQQLPRDKVSTNWREVWSEFHDYIPNSRTPSPSPRPS